MLKTAWRDAIGWEYDMLRSLPPEKANRIYIQAWARSMKRAGLTWWGLCLWIPASCFLSGSTMIVANIVAGLGWGWFVIDAMVHLLLAHRILLVVFKLMTKPFLQQFILEGLLAYDEVLRRDPGIWDAASNTSLQMSEHAK